MAAACAARLDAPWDESMNLLVVVCQPEVTPSILPQQPDRLHLQRPNQKQLANYDSKPLVVYRLPAIVLEVVHFEHRWVN